MKSFLFAGAAVVALLGLSSLAVASPPSSSTPPEECKNPPREELAKQTLSATPRTDAPSLGRGREGNQCSSSAVDA